MHTNRARWAAVVGAAALCGAASQSWADEVTFRFEAEVISVDDSDGFLSDEGVAASVGDVIAGTLTFDPDAPDAVPQNPTFGRYESAGAPYGVQAIVGGRALASPFASIRVLDDAPVSGSTLQEEYTVTGNLHLTRTAFLQVTMLSRRAATAAPVPPFGSDALPLAPPAPGDFQAAYFRLHIRTGALPGIVRDDEVRARLTKLELVEPEIAVNVDVKPDSDTNPLNTRSRGSVPVAVLSTDEFDAATIDAASLTLGDPESGGAAAPLRTDLEDVDGDGRLDLVAHFAMPDLVAAGGIDDSTSALEVRGTTTAGVAIRGVDTVRIVH